VTEKVMIANAMLMDATPLFDALGAEPKVPSTRMGPGFVTVSVPARGALVLQPVEPDLGGYSRYKRVR
jgi:hypothetical protein